MSDIIITPSNPKIDSNVDNITNTVPDTSVQNTPVQDTPVPDNTTDNSIENITENITEEEKKEMIDKISYYRNVALGFIDAHKKDLVSIYMKHTKNNDIPEEERNGVLGINLLEIEERKNIDVALLPLKILPLELTNTILERQQINNEHIIYILIITPLEEKLIEIDIRTLME